MVPVKHDKKRNKKDKVGFTDENAKWLKPKTATSTTSTKV